MPSTFLGFFPRREPRTAPPIRPAAPVAIPATTAAFDPPPPFWLLRWVPWLPLRELLCSLRELPPPPDDEARLRDDAEDERREALELLPLELLAFVPERGLLFEALERPL
jgi:hypothetical protein